MKVFATVDEDGRVTGFYPENYPNLPADAFEISNDVWAQWAGAHDQSRYRWQAGELVYVGPTLDELKADKRYAVNMARHRCCSAGVQYTFPDGVTGTVDTRNLNDAANILGLVTMAQALMPSAPDTVFTSFRDAEDQDHDLTPSQMLALYDVVAARRTASYSNSWAFKNAIAAATTPAELEAIDISAGWPA